MRELIYLGMDFGASNGRGILGRYNGSKLHFEEILRFKNDVLMLHGGLYWNIYYLYQQIIECFKKTNIKGLRLDSMGIDIWAQDFGILTAINKLYGLPHCYRDPRHINGKLRIINNFSKAEIFSRTGMSVNDACSLFQIASLDSEQENILSNGGNILFLSGLLSYFLTGKKACDISVASPTCMYNPKLGQWDYDLLNKINISINLPKIYPNRHLIGKVLENQGAAGTKVYNVPNHDTFCAYAAIEALGLQDSVYLSCGTWALMGVPIKNLILTEQVENNGLSNEQGFDGQRYLMKNHTGLWIMQQCEKQWAIQGYKMDYDILNAQASKDDSCAYINIDDPDFYTPGDMISKVQKHCREMGIKVPCSQTEIYACLSRSLAIKFTNTVELIEAITGNKYESICIVGGGAKNDYLCKLLREFSGKKIFSITDEVAAIGNIISQMVSSGEFSALDDAANMLWNVLDIKTY